jgi:hypothetical protein
VETRWAAWREQFEALLRTLYWDEAEVWLQTDLWGSYHCTWKRRLPTVDDPNDWPPAAPTTEWDYHGPRGNICRG